MINKFLFDIDPKGKKVLYGLIEDEVENTIELGSEIDYCFYKDFDEDDISRNLGGQCFLVFNDNGIKKYLDIDFFKDKAKIQLTEKIAYALPISEDLIDIILDYLDVQLPYEVIYGCFYEHPKKGTVDILERQFKGLFTDSFVQVIKDKVSYFLALQDNEYVLTRNLREAKKFHKSEIRKILIINKFVDRTTDLKELYFSPYQLLRGEDEFFLLNPSPLLVSKKDDSFILKTSNIAIKNSHLLCKSELINTKMKEIHSLMNKEDEFETGFITCYSKYLNLEENQFNLVDNPSKMTLVNKNDFNLFSAIYSIFSETVPTFVKDTNLVNVYEYEENKYRLTSGNEDNFLSTNIIKESVYYDFLKYFISNKAVDLKNGYVLMSKDKYINIEFYENNEFKINFINSSYNATLFTEEQASILVKILNFSITKREFNNIFKSLDRYNIKLQEDNFDIVDEYNNIISEIVNKKYKMDMYNNSLVKLESEKGSLEYLRRHYVKSINDSSLLFEMILTNNNNINNILLVDSYLNLDLIALNNICKKLNRNINVSLISTIKNGYYPSVKLSKHIKFNEIYKNEFCSMPKVFLSKFDLILFSRGFVKQDKTFDYVIKDIIESQDVILANVRNRDTFVDSFSSVFDKIKRKQFLDIENKDEIINISRSELEGNGLSGFNGIYAIDPILDKEFSYHSIVKVKNKKVYDFFK